MCSVKLALLGYSDQISFFEKALAVLDDGLVFFPVIAAAQAE